MDLRRFAPRAAGVAVLLVVLVQLTGACGKRRAPTATGDDEELINVLLQNQSPELAHIFAAGETFPCCRLDPGDTRTIGRNVKEAGGDVLTFQAGRNGVILTEVSCTATRAMTNGDEIGRVVWDGAVLTCIGWDN